MITQETVLVQLIRLVDRVPTPPPPARRSPGRPIFSDRLFLKVLLNMIVRPLHKVGELLAVLEEPTPPMQTVRSPLSTTKGCFPSRRTFERRLKALPETLPEQIGSLGRHQVAPLRPWASSGRAVALDSTLLEAKGSMWHKKDREKGEVPHTSIDTEAHWGKSGWHG